MSLRTIWEIYMLALCLWREAQNQPIEAIAAVACSIRNRTLHASWWNNKIANDYLAVILFPNQYSSFNPGDPNVAKLPKTTDPVFMSCLQTAFNTYSPGMQMDTTGGATSYYDDSIAAPGWTEEMTFTVSVGAFRFYKTTS